MKRTCWTTGSWQYCLSLKEASSISAWSTIINRFLCWFTCVSKYQSIKIKPTNMYITRTRAQFTINTHKCWNWHLCISAGLSIVPPRPCDWDCIFDTISIAWNNFYSMKRTCWTIGSWWCCIRSIPAWFTIIYWFFCGVRCVSPLPSKLNQQLYIKYVHWTILKNVIEISNKMNSCVSHWCYDNRSSPFTILCQYYWTRRTYKTCVYLLN